MDNMRKLELSSEVLGLTEELIKRYKEDKRRYNRKESERLAEDFTLAFSGMTMLMSELDTRRALELIDNNGLIHVMEKSIKRLKKREVIPVC